MVSSVEEAPLAVVRGGLTLDVVVERRDVVVVVGINDVFVVVENVFVDVVVIDVVVEDDDVAWVPSVMLV